MSEVLDKIEKRGIEQGIKEGIKQGIEQGDINRARKDACRMRAKGLSIEDIADILEKDIGTVSTWIGNVSPDVC